jgi:hypothetical protein
MYKGYTDRLRSLKKEHKIINDLTVLCVKCKKVNNILIKPDVLRCYFCTNPILIK